MEQNNTYKKGFIPYALAAFLIGIVGGFSTVLGPAFVQDMGIAYNNTTWTALAQAMSTAACAPILGKVGDVIAHWVCSDFNTFHLYLLEFYCEQMFDIIIHEINR